MKPLYLFIFLYCSLVFAQKTPQELAAKLFKVCADNDVQAYKQLCPPVDVLMVYIKSVDSKGTYPMGEINKAYLRGLNMATAGFDDFQDAVREEGINLSEAKITDTKIEDSEIDYSQGGEVDGTAKIKIVTLYFTAAKKNYSLLLPGMIEIQGQWYISEEPLQLKAE